MNLVTVDNIMNNLKTDVASLMTNAQTALNTLFSSQTPTPVPPEPTPIPPVTNLYDDFKYVETFVTHQTTKNGKWYPEYNSNGYFKADGNGLIMQPGGTELSIYSGSCMIRSTKKFTNFKATLDVITEAQVYTKDSTGKTIVPPGWQATWVIFRHIDKWRHWYVIVGRDKMEVGRKDVPTNITDQATIEKGQMIIWNGGPATPIGTKRKLTIEFIGKTLKIWLDGILQVTLVDDGTMVGGNNQVGRNKLPTASYTSGEFCPYDEGARSRYQDVFIETLP